MARAAESAEGRGGGGGGAGGGASDQSGARAAAELEGMRTHLDFLALAHLADIDRGGPWIDFGTPARMKHTNGSWRNQWGHDGSDSEGTFTRLGASGDVVFSLDEPVALVAHIRMRKHSASQVVVYANSDTMRTIDLQAGVHGYEVPIPASALRRGENQLRLRSPGVGETDTAVAIYDIHLAREGAPAEAGVPPFAELVKEQTFDGVARRALVAPAGTTFSFYAEVPPSAKLAFGIGSSAGGARAHVAIVPADGERSETPVTVGTSWGDQVIDLAAYAHGVVRIDFTSEADADADETVAWAAPQIVVPMPELARRPGQARNVVVLLVDTLRASKLHPYNPGLRVQTPALDALAADSTVFENAQAPENWTKPSVASILTSLHPMTHNTKEEGSSLPEAALMVSEIYHREHITTAMFSANGYVSDRFGFDQGWDHYTNYIRENKRSDAENVFGEAARWIEQHKDERFFVYIQTIDPHVVYDPPDEYLRIYDPHPEEYTGQVRNRETANLIEGAKRVPPRVTFTEADKQRLRDLHDGEISYHDHYLAGFLDRLRELGLFDDMIFVLTADHGEEFEEHGLWGHGHSVFQELLGVPLIVHWPRAEASGLRVPDTVSTIDIVPTVLEASGVAIPEELEGRSLLGYMRGQPPAAPAVAFSDFLDDRRVIRAGRWKLIVRGNLTWTMFDLQTDPGEQHQLDFGDPHRIALRYLRILQGQFLGATNRRDWLHASGSGPSHVLPQADSQIDAELCQQLNALGYVDARCDNL